MPETFASHLDACEQCFKNPRSLCAVGESLAGGAADGILAAKACAWAANRSPTGHATAILVRRVDGEWIDSLEGHRVLCDDVVYDSEDAAIAAARRRWYCDY
jgi:hypothetical protein